MAPRLFPRNPKKPPDATMQPDADADSQLFSKDLAFGHVVAGEPAPDQTTAPAIPALQSQDRQQPGWYRDTDDPGLMRYWDGFHFTGQAKRPSEDGSSNGQAGAEVSVATPVAVNSPMGVTAPVAGSTSLAGNTSSVGDAQSIDDASSVGPEVDITDVDAVVESLLGPSIGAPPYVGEVTDPRSNAKEESASQIPPWTGPTTYLPVVVTAPAKLPENPAAVEAEASPGATEASETPVVAAADNDSVMSQDGHRGNEMSDSSHSEGVADGVSNWGKDAEQAVSRALTVDTPEAWEAVAHVAAVVSEMAQTMQSVADAKQTARQTAKTAEEAAEAARVAAQTASDAKEAAEQMAKAADDAAEAARVAARTAVDAKEAAERTAQASPKAAEVASAASQTAADAKQKAEALEQVVANARIANTPSAWSEALKQTAVATGAKPSVTEQPVAEISNEREAESAPAPALWKRSPLVGGSAGEPIDQTLQMPGSVGSKDSLQPKDSLQQEADGFAELGPAPFLTPAPDAASGSQNDSR